MKIRSTRERDIIMIEKKRKINPKRISIIVNTMKDTMINITKDEMRR